MINTVALRTIQANDVESEEQARLERLHSSLSGKILNVQIHVWSQRSHIMISSTDATASRVDSWEKAQDVKYPLDPVF